MHPQTSHAARAVKRQALCLAQSILHSHRDPTRPRLSGLDPSDRLVLYDLLFVHSRIEEDIGGLIALVVRIPLKELTIERIYGVRNGPHSYLINIRVKGGKHVS